MKMKKIELLIIILLLVGCTNKKICTNSENNQTNQITILNNKKQIKSIKVEIIFSNKEEALNYCTLLKLSETDIKCDDNIITYNNYKDFFNINFKNNEEIIKYLEENNYKCK